MFAVPAHRQHTTVVLLLFAQVDARGSGIRSLLVYRMTRICITGLLFLFGLPLVSPGQAPSAPALLEQGRNLERSGKSAEAERLYEKASRAYPDQPAFHFKLGLFAMARRDWAKAAREFEVCLRSSPRQVDTLLLLAQAYDANGNPDLALGAARRAVEYHPDHSGACRLLGQYLCQSGKCADGLALLLKARGITPGLPGIDYDIGFTYFRLNNWAESGKYLEIALEREPANSQVSFMLAEVARRNRDWEKARLNYERALSAGKRDGATYYGLGSSLATLGQYEAAVPALQEAYRLDPSLPPELHFQLARSLRALGRVAEADREMAVRERLTDLSSSGYRFTMAGDSAEQGLWNKVSGLLREGREADALAAIKAQAPRSNSLYLLGAGYFVIGNIPDAIRNIRAALAQQPGLQDAHAYLGQVLLAVGRLPDAEAEVRAELARDPQNPLALATLGEIRFAQGRWPEAAASIEASRTRHPRALLKLCETYFRLGRKADAEVAANLVRTLAGGDPEMLARVDELLSVWRAR